MNPLVRSYVELANFPTGGAVDVVADLDCFGGAVAVGVLA